MSELPHVFSVLKTNQLRLSIMTHQEFFVSSVESMLAKIAAKRKETSLKLNSELMARFLVEKFACYAIENS
jgi:hypothetical protein